MILKKEIIEYLSEKLSLPFTGIEQDWDIEMADSNRISDFLEFYRQSNLSSDKKIALIALVIASYEDFLNENDLENDDSWNEVKGILESDKEIFSDLINYWSLCDEVEEESLFRITPLIRNIK